MYMDTYPGVGAHLGLYSTCTYICHMDGIILVRGAIVYGKSERAQN